LKRIEAQRAKQNARTLKALDRAIFEMGMALKWKVVAQNAPPGSKIDLKAWDEAQRCNQRSFDAFMLVRRALGYDPDEDEPQPKRHWDAGA
jgi:hypothetical protein